MSFFPRLQAARFALFAPRTGSLAWGLSSEFQQSSDDLHSRVRFLQLFLGGQIFGDRPWRLSGEKVRAIRGVSRGEKLRWNVFFLPVNARARPVRERKRRNLMPGSLRLVPTLFEPPIRVETCAQLNRCSFARQKVRNRQQVQFRTAKAHVPAPIRYTGLPPRGPLNPLSEKSDLLGG